MVLKYYPNVRMIIGTDFSKEMLITAKENAKRYPEKNVKFVWMNNLEMSFPEELFDLVSARHTKINAKQIYNSLAKNGTLIIEGIDQKDCLELKEIFGRGQAYKDEISISKIDYNNLKEAGFSKIEKVEILENEYYQTEDHLMALLVKAPILDNFSEIGNNKDVDYKPIIEQELFKQYVKKYKTEKGILLKRALYGIVAKK